MTYGYIRVSTNKQDTTNQRNEIIEWARLNNIHIDAFVEETVSGTKDPKKRKLGLLLNEVKQNDIVICSEISRLGRSLFMVMDILNICMSKNINVWTVKEGYKLGNDISSAVLAFAFSLSAQIERDLLSQRTKSALALRKAQGIKLGRPKGALGHNTKLTPHEAVIQTLIEQDNTYAEVARLFHVDRSTLKRFCDSRGIKRPIKRNKNSVIEPVADMQGLNCNNVDDGPVTIRI